jgi:hypothetical protein
MTPPTPNIFFNLRKYFFCYQVEEGQMKNGVTVGEGGIYYGLVQTTLPPSY